MTVPRLSDTTIGATYWRGRNYGSRLAIHHPERDHERTLRLEVQIAGANRMHRAWALGELRGYRQATDRP